MTVYFQGTELQDFPVVVGLVSHDDTRYYSSNVRCSIMFNSNSAEYTNYIETDSFSASDFWTHFMFFQTDSGTLSNFVTFYSGGVARLALRTTFNGFELRKWNGSSWVSLGTISSLDFSITTPLDIKITLGNPGTCRVYFGGVPVIVGDSYDLTWSDSITTIDKIRFSQGESTSVTSFYTRISEVIVADWNTIGGKLVLRIPDATGTYSAWAGAGYTSIDERDVDGVYLTSDTADQRYSVSLSDFPALAAGENIENVKITIQALCDASGPQNINLFSRVNSVDNDEADQALTVAPVKLNSSWALSPDTGLVWTPTELNASEFGVRSRT